MSKNQCEQTKNSINAMQSACGAKTRSGQPCKTPGMRNGRCRMHGGNNPGAPKGSANGNYKHGRDTKEAKANSAVLGAHLRYLTVLGNAFLKEQKRLNRENRK